MAAMRLWHGTLLGFSYAFLTSGVAFPFVLEHLSNTPARPQEASPRTPDLSRGRPWESNRWRDAHSGRPRCLLRLRLRHGTRLGVCYHLRTSGVAFPFVIERLSNTPGARPQQPSPCFEPCEACCEQAMGARSLGAPTWLAEGVALVWHAPGGALPSPYQWRRLFHRARAPQQHSGTPSRAISVHARFEPCEACCEQAMGARSLGEPTWLGEG